MEEKIKSLMAKVFVCNIIDININTNKEDIDNWDSLQHLIFISQLEDLFDTKFSPEEIVYMNSYNLILEVMKSKKLCYEV